MGFGHRGQTKISEESIPPLFMIAQASSLTRSALLPAQHIPQTTNKTFGKNQ
jgi:hypothetical protein